MRVMYFPDYSTVCAIIIKKSDDIVDSGNNNTLVEYSYDPFGRRLWKEVSGTRTYFFYSDEGLVAEYDENGAEIRSYGYQPDSTWTTDPLFLKQGSQYYFYQNDHLGTPQKLVAQNGSVGWSASYSAFGEASVDIGTITNNLRFPGQYYDAETGLHYNYHRYYSPGNGRYVSADPIRFVGGDVNLYNYGNCNAITLVDPTGLWRTYKIGPQIEPHVAFDEGFVFDPAAKPTWEDHYYWTKYLTLLLGATYLFTLEDATRLYYHYRTGEGTDMEINFEKAYTDDINIQKAIDKAITQAQSEAEKLSLNSSARMSLVFSQYDTDGYKRFNLMRASFVVNCQSIVRFFPFRVSYHSVH